MDSYPPIRLAERFRDLRGMRILLVEDNELNQEVAVELMKSVGIEITIANDGLKALQVVQSQTFDAILMDVQMPEMDGYAATREIRKAESRKQEAEGENTRHSSTPIIAMTANAAAEDRRSALESGMDDFLSKPIIPHQLFTMLSKWFLYRLDETSPHQHDIAQVSPDSPVTFASINTPLPTYMPGVDVAAGVFRVGGNFSRYVMLLQQFVNRYATIPDEIEELLTCRRIQPVRQLVHTLKGVTGNLGADMLHKDFEAFEAALREDLSDLWGVHLQQLRRSFRQVIDAAAVLSSSEYAVPATAIPPALPRKILDTPTILPRILQLQRFLTENDTESLPCTAALVEICAATELAPQIAQLKMIVDQYDFERALHAVERIIDQLKHVP